jgi:cystathionine beta-lyase
VDFCRHHDLVLVSDEIHCDLILDELEHVPAALACPDDADRIVTLMAPSKTFNLPGLNFAFAIVAEEALRTRFQRPGEGVLPFPGCFAIAAAEAAYREGGPWLTALVEYLRGNRDLVESFVAGLSDVSMTHVEATYLAWLDVRELGLSDPAEACRAAGVALSAGAAFGDPAYLRLNFGCRREILEKALRRLGAVFA